MSKVRIFDKKRSMSIDIVDFFDGLTIGEVQAQLSSLATKYEKEILNEDIEVRFSADDYGYDGGIELDLRVMRWETDAEYEKRTKEEQIEKERAKKRAADKRAKKLATASKTEQEERELLAKLKAKYEQK